MSLTKKLVLSGVASALFLTLSSAAMADDYGAVAYESPSDPGWPCAVIMCLAGGKGVSECVTPVRNFYKMMLKPHYSFPGCDIGSGNGVQLGHQQVNDCNPAYPVDAGVSVIGSRGGGGGGEPVYGRTCQDPSRTMLVESPSCNKQHRDQQCPMVEVTAAYTETGTDRTNTVDITIAGKVIHHTWGAADAQ